MEKNFLPGSALLCRARAFLFAGIVRIWLRFILVVPLGWMDPLGRGDAFSIL